MACTNIQTDLLTCGVTALTPECGDNIWLNFDAPTLATIDSSAASAIVGSVGSEDSWCGWAYRFYFGNPASGNAITPTDVVEGVEVVVRHRKTSFPSATVNVQLEKDLVVFGNEKNVTCSTDYITTTFGGSTDTWGATAGDLFFGNVVDDNFGVRVWANGVATLSGSYSVLLDYLAIRLHLCRYPSGMDIGVNI